MGYREIAKAKNKKAIERIKKSSFRGSGRRLLKKLVAPAKKPSGETTSKKFKNDLNLGNIKQRIKTLKDLE